MKNIFVNLNVSHSKNLTIERKCVWEESLDLLFIP